MLKRFLSLLIFFVVGFQLSAKEDVILVSGKGEKEVFIVKESQELVEFKDLKTGATQKVKSDLVIAVKYKDAHPTFERAMEAVATGNWGFALQNIIGAKKAMTKSRNNWHKLYISYYTGKILSEYSKSTPKYVKNAEQYLAKFIKEGSKSRFYPNAHLDLSDLYVRMKKFEDARKTLMTLEKASKSSYWKGQAQAEIAKTYLAEGKMSEAMAIGTKLLGAGVFNSSIVDVFTAVLIDKEGKYDKAYSLSAKLLGKGDKKMKEKVYELRGCAAYHLKKYDEALEDLLKAQLLYGTKSAASSRLNLYLTSTIYVLMKVKPSEYGGWEYNAPYVTLRKSLSVADNKKFSKLVQKI